MKSNGLYCLVVKPKVIKSLLTLQLADSIANKTTFLEFNTNPSSVLYISAEMTSAQLLDRINKIDLNLNDNIKSNNKGNGIDNDYANNNYYEKDFDKYNSNKDNFEMSL